MSPSLESPSLPLWVQYLDVFGGLLFAALAARFVWKQNKIFLAQNKLFENQNEILSKQNELMDQFELNKVSLTREKYELSRIAASDFMDRFVAGGIGNLNAELENLSKLGVELNTLSGLFASRHPMPMPNDRVRFSQWRDQSTKLSAAIAKARAYQEKNREVEAELVIVGKKDP